MISGDLFNATAEKITRATDEYNDKTYSSTGATVNCRFRESSMLTESGDHTELSINEDTPDLWFPGDVDTVNGDVWLVHIGSNSHYRRITGLIFARGADSSIQFVKCMTERYLVVS